MIERKTETRIVGPSSGSVTWRNACQRSAPSISAASSSSLRDALEPGQHQDHVEAEVLPRDDHEQREHHEARRRRASPGPGRRGRPPSAPCRRSACGWSSSRKTMPVTTSERTYGRKNSSRNMARPRNRRLSITASASENGIWIASDRTMTSTLLPIAARKASLRQRDLVVLEADEVGERLQPVPLVEAVVRGLDDREQDEHDVERERRQQEQRRSSATSTDARRHRGCLVVGRSVPSCAASSATAVESSGPAGAGPLSCGSLRAMRSQVASTGQPRRR